VRGHHTASSAFLQCVGTVTGISSNIVDVLLNELFTGIDFQKRGILRSHILATTKTIIVYNSQFLYLKPVPVLFLLKKQGETF
jgi:hypothetical protein